jgi:hypothetical protein
VTPACTVARSLFDFLFVSLIARWILPMPRPSRMTISTTIGTTIGTTADLKSRAVPRAQQAVAPADARTTVGLHHALDAAQAVTDPIFSTLDQCRSLTHMHRLSVALAADARDHTSPRRLPVGFLPPVLP